MAKKPEKPTLNLKPTQEGTYFKPSHAVSYGATGVEGIGYRATKAQPMHVHFTPDIEKFRKNPELTECDASGFDSKAVLEEEDSKSKPLSFAQTDLTGAPVGDKKPTAPLDGDEDFIIEEDDENGEGDQNDGEGGEGSDEIIEEDGEGSEGGEGAGDGDDLTDEEKQALADEEAKKAEEEAEKAREKVLKARDKKRAKNEGILADPEANEDQIAKATKALEQIKKDEAKEAETSGE